MSSANVHAHAHAPQPPVPVPFANGGVHRATATMTPHDKVERRKRLSREAEVMREMLRAKERELAELDAETEGGEEGRREVDVDGEG